MPSFVQMRACRLLGATRTNNGLLFIGPFWKRKSIKLESKCNNCHTRKLMWKYSLQTRSYMYLSWPLWRWVVVIQFLVHSGDRRFCWRGFDKLSSQIFKLFSIVQFVCLNCCYTYISYVTACDTDSLLPLSVRKAIYGILSVFLCDVFIHKDIKVFGKLTSS